MDKINGLEVKREIIAKKDKGDDRLALLSGFVRVSFSVLRRGNERHLAVDCQVDFVRDHIAALMMEQFKVKPMSNRDVLLDDGADAESYVKQNVEPQSNKTELRFFDSDKLLRSLYILDGDDYFAIKGIDERFYANAAAYVRGMFLGCGSLSVPHTDGGAQKRGGYHIEFALGSRELADDFVKLLKSIGISFKVTVRAEKCVAYTKDGGSVSDCLALLGADKTVLELNNTMAYLAVKDNANRARNCDVANINRVINAAVDITEAIALIERHAGLDSLDKKLREAAIVRKNDPSASIGALASELGISKSGLKHRYDKIAEIAKKYDKEKR